MRILLLAGLAAILAYGIVTYRNRSMAEALQARADLERVCLAQKSYVETKSLLKTVPEQDLKKERSKHFEEEVKSSLVREALVEAERSPAGNRRKPLDHVAAKAGVQDWKCPELDQL